MTGARTAAEITRLGVLGWPVAHSRSPAMHNAALAAAGLTRWRYQLLPAAPDLFCELVTALPGAGFRGANVTIPHKGGGAGARHRADRPGAGDRGGQHVDLRARGRDRRRQHRRPGARRRPAAGRSPEQRARARCGRQRPRRRLGAAGRRRARGPGVESQRRSRRPAVRRAGRRRRSRQRRRPTRWAPTCSSTAPRWGWTDRTRLTACRSAPTPSAPTAASSISSTPRRARAGGGRPRARRGGGRRAGAARRAGGAQLRALHRATRTGGGDARGRAPSYRGRP